MSLPVLKPRFALWFGNFFEPFFSDREQVAQGFDELKSLGYNSLNLDSKPWEDFFARYRGEAASPYVAMHEFMMDCARERGLDWSHLAVYLCGDNLYPTIRDVPPVRGEEAVAVDGQPMGTYKYWSPKAQQSMVDHVRGLLRLYGDGMHRRNDGRIVMQTMFDPIAKPSFDAEGRGQYLHWLSQRYGGDIGQFNARYALQAKSFDELQAHEYWLRPEALNWVGGAMPTREDMERRTPDFHRWIDNQRWLTEVMVAHFATMKPRWRELQPALFLEPVLHQWGYFFNPPGQDDWATGKRALDVWQLAPHVDGVLFITAPLNAENLPDAMPVSVEGSIMRSANGGSGFTSGLYLGRHVNGDIYRQVPPAEAIATLVAAGSAHMHHYGYSGLDDGGVLYRMDEGFKQSLRDGLGWAARVVPQLQQDRPREIALLFPREMSLYEPLPLDTQGRHRTDLLGWYNQFIDLGWHVDILHPEQVLQGQLSDYRCLAVPHNSLYDLGDNQALEAAIGQWVAQGGTLLHGPGCLLAQRAFGMQEHAVDFEGIAWDEQIIPHGWRTVAFETGQALARYVDCGESALSELTFGRGRVLSFGFEYGHAYACRTMPIVPPKYGRREMHPVVLLKRTPVEALIGTAPHALLAPRKGLEMARFGDQAILINHRAHPVPLAGLSYRHADHLVPSTEGWLAAHSAVHLSL